MDIDLFSEMIKDLVFDYDEVAIPGLGTFVSEVVPSSFSDKGYTINPPYRKLSFRQRQGDGSRLLDSCSRLSGLAPAESEAALTEFISGLKQILKSKKVVVFPGLGRLRATKENAFFFIPDEDLDIYSYGFGLEPVSLKTHEETPEEVSSAVAGLKELVDGPVISCAMDGAALAEKTEAATVHDEERAGTSAERQTETMKSSTETGCSTETGRGAVAKLTLALAIAVGAAVLLLGIFMLLSRIAPDFVDTLLYTPEELRIINS